MADLPKDPMILLSVVNTKLRDFYADLDTLCQEMQIEKKELTEKLASIDLFRCHRCLIWCMRHTGLSLLFY